MTRRLRAHRWAITITAVGALVVAHHLVGLDRLPPGLHSDEASIGYNAWAIAHHGVDEHGAWFPLYFEAFGEYKNPVYVYALAPLTWFLPLSPATERLPAALSGIGTCLVAALCAWRLTRSRSATLLTLLTAATMPWLVLQSRVGFEVAAMTVLLMAALWCLARAESTGSTGWYAGAGAALGLSTLAYSSGRLLGAALAAAFVFVHLPYAELAGWVRRRKNRPGPASWMWFLAGPAAAYAAVGGYALRHPGALTARFDVISVTADGASQPAAFLRLLRNWPDYLDGPFLLATGDANPRHHTGVGGMILVATLPAVLAGAVVCVRRRREPLCRFILAGTVLAPLPAALTLESVPHALRSAGMVPFLLVLAALGWEELLRWLRRPALAGLLVVAWGAQAGWYLLDLETAYPARATVAFDAQEGPTIVEAAGLAHGHRLLLSTSLDAPSIQALFALAPPPRTGDARTLAPLRIGEADPASIATEAGTGDVLVLSGDDPIPPGATTLVERRAQAPGGVSQRYVVARR